MTDLKTAKNDRSVSAFIRGIPGQHQRNDCRRLLQLMREVTGARPAMWGSSIVGFGQYHYRYKTGREGNWFLTGFSPRKNATVVYVMSGFRSRSRRLKALGRHSLGKSCLYLRSLDDIDLNVLRSLVKDSVKQLRRKAHAIRF